jgi:tetraacyldisaccharide 4'-kinase
LIHFLHQVQGIPLLIVVLLYPVLIMASGLYWLVITIRNIIYDGKKPWSNGLTVISLGNLSSGGTGKTPVGLAMVRDLKARNIRVGVVLRGYGKKEGLSDEAELYRKVLATGEVFETPDRRDGLTRAKQAGLEWVILDDAFQHRRVSRQADIVLIDATRPPWDDHLLPWGFLREGERALQRADAVVLTRTEQVSEVLLAEIKNKVSKHVSVARTFSASTRVIRWVDLQGIPSHGHSKAYLVSAIGNPENFSRTAKQSGVEVVGKRWFNDHHHFSESEMMECSKAAKALGAVILMTSKDAVKWHHDPADAFVLDIGVELPWDELWRELSLLKVVK